MKTALIMLAVCLTGCAGAAPPPLTKKQVREEWKRIGCHFDAGAHLSPCLSDDEKCCQLVKEDR